ncbi:MAG: hypothetical protein J7L12_03805 [Desulfurococcales archaeon]|nr:hypothetical protein [Desulfurococcales archaeon]
MKRGSVTDLARILNTSVAVAWKRLELLRKLRISYSVNINYSKIGLYQLAFFFKRFIPFELLRIPYVRYYTLSLSPPGVFVVFSVPRHLWIKFSELIIDNVGCEPDEVWLVKKFLPFKQEISRWVNPQNYTMFIDWNVITERILSVGERAVNWDLQDSLDDVKFDTIDLLIIRELQRDPFAPLQEITENAAKVANKLKLGVSVTYKKILKHFRRDVVGHNLIFNVVPAHVPLDYSNTIYFLVSITPCKGWSLALYEALSSHPFFGCRVDRLGRVTAFVVLPQGEISNFNMFLKNLRDLGIIEEWEVFVLDRVNRRAFTLPYDMYSPITGWRLPQLGSRNK